MKKHTKFEDWPQTITLNEQTFISPTVEKACEYLRNARNEEGDWGYYKGLPIDIHASSLAIEALRICKSPENETIAEDAVARIKTIIGKNIDTLEIQQLVNLLNILSGTELRDSELELKAVARLKDLQHNAGWGDPKPSISLSCGVILALIKLKPPPQDVIKQWVDYLAQCQHSDDGGWGATPDSKSAIIPTSHALRVLNRFSYKSLAKTRSASIEFFKSYFQTKGWSELDDTFTISTVLRALGEIEEFPFEIIQQGIYSLYERVNPDGGWGAVKGEPSNVEHTALSLLALSSVGENEFVPSRLVKATLETAESEIIQLQNERDKLLGGIDQRVQKEMKNVIHERNKLQQNVSSYKEKVTDLETELKNIGSKFSTLRDKYDFMASEIGHRPKYLQAYDYKNIVIITISTTIIVSIIAYFFLKDNIILFSVIIITLFIASLSYLRTQQIKQYRFRRRDELEFGPEIKFFTREFSYLFDEWPTSKIEDFLFKLTREGTRIPSEESEAYSMYLADKYAEKRMNHMRIGDITRRFMKLPPSARMVVIDEIRNMRRFL